MARIRYIAPFATLFIVLLVTVESAWAEAKLYFADNTTQVIKRINSDGTGVETIVTTSSNTVLGLAIDLPNRKIYWTYDTPGTGSIYRANLDGSNPELLVSGIASPFDVAVDGTGGKIYWADASSSKISRSNLDGSNVQDILTSAQSIGVVISLTLDTSAGKIYWNDVSTQAVHRANLDGSSRQTLVADPTLDFDIPRGIQVYGAKVYWTDTTLNTIYRANLDGTSPETVLSSVDAVDLTIPADGSRMYWINGAAGKIQSANLDGSSTQDVYTYSGISVGALIQVVLTPEINLKGNSVSITDGDTSPSSGDHTNFGSADITIGTIQRTFTIENGDYGLLNISGSPRVTVSGSHAADFTVTTPPTASVSANSSQTFVVTFNPSAAGVREATLSITNDDSDEGTYDFAISGTGTAPEIAVQGNSASIANGHSSPSTSDGTAFGSADIATSGTVTQTFTITNSGNGDLTISGNPRVALSGANVNQFSVFTQPAGTVASGGGTSTFDIRFAPTSVGLKSAVVSITNDDSDENPFTFSISGEGVDSTDTDGDGVPNSSDSDDDNDGVSDAQELTDGTDSLDEGSALVVLPAEFCSEWNGFLDGLWNILEYVNLSSQAKTVTTTIKDLNGVAQSANAVNVLPGAQTDVLVHSMQGWTPNSYGQVCVSVEGGQPGDIDGRMVYYKPNSPTTTSSSDVQFAFAMPFSDGLSGPQYVFFNTYQPSLDPADASNPVANWIQLTNQASSEKSGTLTFYGQDGLVLATQSVTLAGGARQDFSGHQFGPNLVGMIGWSPTDSSTGFQMRNVRYYYDNPILSNSFDSAFQLEGLKGSGAALLAPVDTRSGSSIIEVGNSSNAAATINIEVYDAAGALVYNEAPTLPGHGSRHIILDTILPNALGLARVDGPRAGSTVATVMQYIRTPSAGIRSIYGIQAKEPLAAVMKGSYNTFLDQGCALLVGSTTTQTVTVSARRFDGTDVVTGTVLNVAANGVVEFAVCNLEAPNFYGVVTVQPSAINTAVSHIVRLGESESYRFPTPAR